MNINYKLILGKYAKVLLSSFLAGVMIALSGMIYLGACALGVHQIAASLLATVGFLIVSLYGYHLYTAKVCYVFDNNALYIGEVLVSILGNYIGVLACALLIKCTDLMLDTSNFYAALSSYVQPRMEEGVLSTLILSFFCGLLIYIGFNTYKKAEQPIAKFVTLFLCIGGFMIANLEHCISDIFFYNLYKPFDGALALKIFYAGLGNTVGGILIPLLNKLRSKIKSI